MTPSIRIIVCFISLASANAAPAISCYSRTCEDSGPDAVSMLQGQPRISNLVLDQHGKNDKLKATTPSSSAGPPVSSAEESISRPEEPEATTTTTIATTTTTSTEACNIRLESRHFRSADMGVYVYKGQYDGRPEYQKSGGKLLYYSASANQWRVANNYNPQVKCVFKMYGKCASEKSEGMDIKADDDASSPASVVRWKVQTTYTYLGKDRWEWNKDKSLTATCDQAKGEVSNGGQNKRKRRGGKRR